jgi:hypothetical protein
MHERMASAFAEFRGLFIAQRGEGVTTRRTGFAMSTFMQSTDRSQYVHPLVPSMLTCGK